MWCKETPLGKLLSIVSPQGKKKKGKKKTPLYITDSDLGMFQAGFSFRGSGGGRIPF